MSETLLSFLRRRKGPKPTGYVINMWEHKGWGDNLYWFNSPGQRGSSSERWTLGSHAVRLPRVGDEIRGKMQSGRVGRWVVRDVELMRGVSDGFFAECEPLTPFYADELRVA